MNFAPLELLSVAILIDSAFVLLRYIMYNVCPNSVYANGRNRFYAEPVRLKNADNVKLVHVPPTQTLHVLDAGCGTGNYSKAFLGYGVGQVTLLDVSIEMLEKAKAKLEPEFKAGNNVAIVPAKLPEMPLQNGTVDVVVFNCVLHHLVSDPDGTTFPEIENALAEAHRVLKTGGIICIMTALPFILKGSFWYAGIRASIAEKAAKRYPTVSQFDYMFGNTMFQPLNVLNIRLKEMLNKYRNPEGPLDKDWRDFTVLYNEATEEELQYVQDEVRRMKDAGTLEAYMNEHDKMNETGLLTLIFARAL